MMQYIKYIIIVFGVHFYGHSMQNQQKYIDYQTLKAQVSPNFKNKSISGNVSYTFTILKDVDSVFIDAINMEFKNVKLDNDSVIYKVNKDKIWILNAFKAGHQYKLSFEYKAMPKKALYFVDKLNDEHQIWTQGQGKYTSHWLPSFDDVNEKLEFDLSITYHSDYKVISNGKLIGKTNSSNTTTWRYDMQQPMSSYLAAFVVGKYNSKKIKSSSGIPLSLFYYLNDSLKVEPTYRYTKQIFDFLENEIGVPYPWQNYKQVPVKDFLYAGMENTGTTIFSDNFMVDAIGFNDQNYINVNAHELAHQWFGNLVTATSSTHHWLQEGFATYYALLAERAIFGDDYFYWKLYRSAEDLKVQERLKKHTVLLDSKSSSLTFYQRGAWVLFMLREFIGDDYFKMAIKNYLTQFKYKSVQTNNFITAVEAVSGYDLSDFVKKWIESSSFRYEEAILTLKQKSTFFSEYEMVDCEVWNSKCDDYLSYPVSDKAKIKLISQRPDRITKQTFKNSLEVRRAIAIHLTKIPEKLKTTYESLLGDNSYQTKEAALFNLWNNFPDEQIMYLNNTKVLSMLSNKKSKILWLTLALVTPNFNTSKKASYLEELTLYTSPVYGFEIREVAFSYLKRIQACFDECNKNLEKAKQHHNWRFKVFAENLFPLQK